MKQNRLTLWGFTKANLAYKPLTSLFNVLLLAIGVAVILCAVHLNRQIEHKLTKDLRGIDLVIGAKGSPLQIILSSVFHMDIPTGNISLKEVKTLQKNPLIQSTVPLALGDNYNGYRIVGTNENFFNHYQVKLSEGRFFETEMEVVVGAEIATKHALKLGDSIVGAHGLVGSADLHADNPYKIVGILEQSETVANRLILTPIESVWHVHEYEETHSEHEHHDETHSEESHAEDDDNNKEITSLLITYKSPLAAVKLPRLVNESTSMQAASPALEMARLMKLIGTGQDILSVFGFLLLFISGLGLCVTLYNAINDRRYDIAVMRVMGATKHKIFSLVMTEVLWTVFIGYAVGIILSQIFFKLISIWIESEKHIMLIQPSFGHAEIYCFIMSLGLGILAGFIPAMLAYRTNIAKVLNQ